MKLKGSIKDISLNYVTHKPLITLQITNQIDILNDEFNKLKEEELLDIELEKHREIRGLQANSYFHVLINKLARYYNVSDDDMKIKMNLQYGTIATDENEKVIGCKLPKGTDMKLFYPYARWYKEDADGCDCYLFYKRTHTLNSLEFSKLLNGVIMECKDVGIKTIDEIELERMMKDYDKCFK